MHLNSSYQIINRDNSAFLVNIEDGDVFEINDVTESILSNCYRINNAKELVRLIYDVFKDTPGDFSETDLLAFVNEMINARIIVID